VRLINQIIAEFFGNRALFEFLSCTLLYCKVLSFRAAIRNADSESIKTYAIDSRMVGNIKKWASLLGASILDGQEKFEFYRQLAALSRSWIT